MNLIPTPQVVSERDGSVAMQAFALPAQCPFLTDVMHELWVESGGRLEGGDRPLHFAQVDGMTAEEYRLDVRGDGATISFSTPRGAYYGFVTLCELGKLHQGRAPCADIHDWSLLGVRAVTDDISRGQLSHLTHLKSIVKRLSLLKLNMYMPYIEDVFRFQSEPEIGKYSDPIPAEEWRELTAYGKRYFVDVRPIFNTLGHWDRIGCLEKYRELMLTAEQSSQPAYFTLDPRNPKVRPLLSKLLGELVDAFGPGLLHVGGDEPLHLREVLGAEQAAELYNAHYRWLYQEVKRLGCEMVMYSDMYTPYWGDYGVGTEALASLPKDIQMVFWWYDPDADYSVVPALMDAGFTTYLSPSTSNCRVLMPETAQTYRNTEVLMATAGARSAGLMMSGWGDGMDCPRELGWHGYAIGAEFGWSSKSASHNTLMQTFHRQFCGFGEEFDYTRIAPLSAYQLFQIPGWSNYRRAWREFWRDPREPVDAEMKQHAPAALDALREAQAYLQRLSPRFNHEFFACINFGAKRLEWLARKLMLLETGRYHTREQAKAATPAIQEMIRELRQLRDTARARWFASNQQAQWGYVDGRYHDLTDAYASLARYCENVVHYQTSRKYMLFQRDG